MTAAYVYGKDISFWQGEMNGEQFIKHNHFVMIRASYGNKTKDGQLDNNKRWARRLGVPRHYYHFCVPGPGTAQKQAEFFWSCIDDDGDQLDPIGDLETIGNFGNTVLGLQAVTEDDNPASQGYQMGDLIDVAKLAYKPPKLGILSYAVSAALPSGIQQSMHDWISKFYQRLYELSGFRAEHYTSPNFHNTYLPRTDIPRDHPLDVAHWNGKPNAPMLPYDWSLRNNPPPHRHHQYAVLAEGALHGAQSKSIDAQVYNGDRAAFEQRYKVKLWDLEGDVPPPPPPAPDPQPAPVQPGDVVRITIPAGSAVGSIYTHRVPDVSTTSRNGAITVGADVVVRAVALLPGGDGKLMYRTGEGVWFAGWLAVKTTATERVP